VSFEGDKTPNIHPTEVKARVKINSKDEILQSELAKYRKLAEYEN
jgi:hypothetical protein